MIVIMALAPLLLAEATLQDGQLSKAYLIEAVRLSAVQARELVPPAADGMSFVFLVARKPGVSGLPTLAETRSFELDGQRYPPPAANSPEPSTEIYDLSEFRKKIRPDLAEQLPSVPDRASSVLVVHIGGGPLKTGARGRVKLEFGWDNRTEDFWFAFTLPAMR
jgi:hypothetical protein